MLSDLFQTTSKIVSLARSGQIKHARKLFEKMPQRDIVAWNAMITSYSQLGLHQQALSLFTRMRTQNARPDNFSFTSTLSSCAGLPDLHLGTKIHALVFLMGYSSSLPVNNSLIDMYGKCLDSSNAYKVFEEMSVRNEVSWCSVLFAYTNLGQFGIAHHIFVEMPKRVEIAWNIMIAGFARYGKVESCVELFNQMRENSCPFDQWTLSAMINACTESLEISFAFSFHAFIIKSGWSSSVEIKNSILSFFAGIGCQDDAIKVFDSIKSPTQVSFNAILDTHMKSGNPEKALVVFESFPERNIVSWTSMIIGYARNDKGEEAISFFVYMIRNSLHPDDFTFGAVLHACSSLAILGHGKMIHCCIIQNGFQSYGYIENGLVNMYAKCGDLDGSSQIFNDIVHKDLVSWNTMLFGFGFHGKAVKALKLYREMVELGVKPDKVTFIGLLMSCSHSGLVEESQVIFESMKSVYGISHEEDHFACMVDLLGRGGYLEEAKAFAWKYSKMENSFFEGLLGACFEYEDVGLGTKMGETLKSLEPKKDMSYVMLSNLYSSKGKWKEAEVVRKVMEDQGVKKIPGCSWIEVRNMVKAFVAGGSYLEMEETSMVLYILEYEMRNPFFSSVILE